MDELQLSGKKYISARRAAELTGYAKDYIGQLARGGKVAATKIGRAWYVEEGEIKAIAELPSIPVDLEEGAVPQVPSALQRQALHSIHSLQALDKNKTFSLRTWEPVRYSSDSSALFPELITFPEQKEKVIEAATYTIPIHTIVPDTKNNVVLSHISETSIVPPVLYQKNNTTEKKKTILRHKTSVFPTPLALGATFVVLIIPLMLGSVFPWEKEFGPAASELAATGALPPFSLPENPFSYLGQVFHLGINTLMFFGNLIISSAGVFFKGGLDFIVQFFHLG